VPFALVREDQSPPRSCAVRLAFGVSVDPSKETAHFLSWLQWNQLNSVFVSDDLDFLTWANAQWFSDCTRKKNLKLGRDHYRFHFASH